MEFNIVAVIPARRGSTRLQEKPLKGIVGKSLVERVWNQASLCKDINSLYVATDDQEIRQLSESFGANVVMTSVEAPTGSARVAEAIQKLNIQWDIALNVQGDMPFIEPDAISLAINYFKENFDNFDMVTIAIPIYDREEFTKPTAVKVVIGDGGRALYFSRAPIPYPRDDDEWKIVPGSDRRVFGLKHIGLYLFKKEALYALSDNSLEASIENVEKLEQLRLLTLGFRIGVAIIPRELMEYSIEIDTPEDLEKAIEHAKGLK